MKVEFGVKVCKSVSVVSVWYDSWLGERVYRSSDQMFKKKPWYLPDKDFFP